MIRYFFSRSFLLSLAMLWGLFWINFLGTVYGYIWYGEQLAETFGTEPLWYLPFVPDSPTASLFFTAVIAYLILDARRRPRSGKIGIWRGFVEAFAVVTSFKYGIWAVSMILAAAAQGDATTWKDYMLMFSHLGMAAEALLYVRCYRYSRASIAAVAVWTLANDYMDYGQGVYPWLPRVLEDDVPDIAVFTLSLSFVSIVIALILIKLRPKAV